MPTNLELESELKKFKAEFIKYKQETSTIVDKLNSDFILKSISPSPTDGLELDISTLKLELSEQRAIVASQSRKVRELELKVNQLEEESSERRDIAARDPVVDQPVGHRW
jgi:hypothetical protein